MSRNAASLNYVRERNGRADCLVIVPMFRVHVINSDFTASDDFETDDAEAARKQGLKAALQIGSDEICNGSPFFGAEVRVEADGDVKERFLVSIGQSPLQ